MEQQGRLEEAEALTVADLGVVHRVRLGHFEEGVLADPARLAEVLVAGEGAVDVLLDHRLPAAVLSTGQPRSQHAAARRSNRTVGADF